MHGDVPVVFFHIPKTAGMTLTSVFERLYNGRRQFLAGQGGATHIEDCARFMQTSEEQRRGYGYLAGHIEIGVLAAIPGRPFVFTFLRNPWDRLVSLYCYVKRSPDHHAHPWIAERNASLEDFALDCPWDEVQNGMTRRLAGVPLARSGDKRLLRQAVVNLHKYFGFVGLMESFDKSLFCLGRLLGLDAVSLAYTRKNVSPVSKTAPACNPAAKERILARNALDLELYDLYGKLFKDEAAKLLRGPELKEFARFKREVKLLARAQEIAGRCAR